jgi:hypothetical protein
MVKLGSFTVEIIDACTNIALYEHSRADGRVFVEVEPNAEYFIRVKSSYHGTILLTYEVGGQGLGSTKSMFQNGESPAFVLETASVMDYATHADGNPWTGNVIFQIHQGVPQKIKVDNGIKYTRRQGNLLARAEFHYSVLLMG